MGDRVLQQESFSMRRYAYLVTCFMSLATPACASWTIVVLPDTQNYVNAPANVPVFEAQTQWIVDNKDALAIQIVLHEGDITDHNTPEEWATAKKAMRTLDGHVPYTMVLGNHDFDPAPFDRSTNLLNDYFALADNPLNSITTEKIAGDLANTYSRFAAPDGRKILVFSLEYVPQPEVLAWAGDICEQFPDHTAIVLVHANVHEGPAVDGEPTTNRHAFGNDLWEILTSQHKNVEMVLNGHHPDGDDTDPHGPLTTARQSSPGKNGNVIHEMAFNSQQQPNGGNGYLRLLEFMDDGTTVQVRTYSPTLDRWLTSDRNEFQLKLTPLFPADANKTK